MIPITEMRTYVFLPTTSTQEKLLNKEIKGVSRFGDFNEQQRYLKDFCFNEGIPLHSIRDQDGKLHPSFSLLSWFSVSDRMIFRASFYHDNGQPSLARDPFFAHHRGKKMLFEDGRNGVLGWADDKSSFFVREADEFGYLRAIATKNIEGKKITEQAILNHLFARPGM